MLLKEGLEPAKAEFLCFKYSKILLYFIKMYIKM